MHDRDDAVGQCVQTARIHRTIPRALVVLAENVASSLGVRCQPFAPARSSTHLISSSSWIACSVAVSASERGSPSSPAA